MIKSIILGGGCFWCTEAIFQKVKGVIKVTSGYSGGKTENPTYELISTGSTDHVEVIKVEYDEAIVSLAEILEIFFKTHDPTTLNQQGNDMGSQYRSVIFVNDKSEIDIAKKAIQDIEAEQIYSDPIVTEVEMLNKFYEAEEYHKNYFALHPEQAYCRVVINPKIRKFMEKFKDKVKA